MPQLADRFQIYTELTRRLALAVNDQDAGSKIFNRLRSGSSLHPVNAATRCDSRCSRVLMRVLIACRVDADPRDANLSYTDNGQPVVHGQRVV